MAFLDQNPALGYPIAAGLGLISLPLVIVISLAYVYNQFADFLPLQGALRGMGAPLFVNVSLPLWKALHGRA